MMGLSFPEAYAQSFLLIFVSSWFFLVFSFSRFLVFSSFSSLFFFSLSSLILYSSSSNHQTHLQFTNDNFRKTLVRKYYNTKLLIKKKEKKEKKIFSSLCSSRFESYLDNVIIGQTSFSRWSFSNNSSFFDWGILSYSFFISYKKRLGWADKFWIIYSSSHSLSLSQKKKVGVRKFAIHKAKLITFDDNEENRFINDCVVVAVVLNTHYFFVIMQVIRRDEKWVMLYFFA